MNTYVISFARTIHYGDVEVQANSIDEAYEMTADWGSDDLTETGGHWEIEVQ